MGKLLCLALVVGCSSSSGPKPTTETSPATIEAEPAAAAPAAPTQEEQVNALQAEVDAFAGELAKVTSAVPDAATSPDRTNLLARLDELDRTRNTLMAKAVKIGNPRLAGALDEYGPPLANTREQVRSAQADADRADAKAKLEQLRREKAEMDARQKTYKANNRM